MPLSKWIFAALAVTVVGLGIPAMRHLRETPPPPPPALRLTFGPPPGVELGSGDEPLDLAIAPDERQIVFAATRAGRTALWRRAIDSARAEAIDGTEGAQLPAWSPSGDAIAFFSGGRLRTVALVDGTLRDLADAPSPSGVTWLPGGSMLFAPRSNGAIQRLQDGVVTPATTLRTGERAHVWPFATSAGSFVYTAVQESGRRTVRLVRDGEERDLAATSGHGQVAAGYLLTVRDNVLLAHGLDEGAGTVEGRSLPVVTGVGVTSAGRGLFFASPRLLLTAATAPRARVLTWFDFEGARTGTASDPGDFWQVRLSRDDRFAAVTLVAPLLRTLDIAVMPLVSGGSPSPLTLALAADSDPVWAPDGRRLLFRSLQTGRPALFTKPAHDVTAEGEAFVEGDATPTDWTGSSVIAHVPDSSSGFDIVEIDVARRTRMPIAKSGFNDTDGRRSPDGAWMAYVSDESGRPDIYATRGEGDRVRVSFGGGTRPRWSRDGRALFFSRGATVMRATLLNTSPPSFAPAVAVLEGDDIRDFDVAHQRDALLAIVPVATSPPAPISVIVDWRSMLRQYE